ncbi:transposase [Alistipes sp.]|uniref:transposase n=1 Tax=Alistipes sp. TaxID=1872444 RepID=UPI003AF120C6
MGKGRSKDLIKKRNIALLLRYHELTEVQRLRFDDALKLLSEREFFISEERIVAIIRDCHHLIEDGKVKPYPRVRLPKLSAGDLALFTEQNP